MRIVIPTIYYNPDQPGGGSRLAFEEAQYLAQHGHDVWLLAQAITPDQPEHEMDRGLHVLRYQRTPLPLLNPHRRSIDQEQTAHLLTKYIPQPIDVVHGHMLLQYQGALSVYGRTARTCFSVHSPVMPETLARAAGQSPLSHVRFGISGRILNRMERQILLQSDVVQAFSQYTKQLLGELHGAALADKVVVVPGWVDVNRFQIIADRAAIKSRLGWPLDVPTLFTLRRLVTRMGLPTLIKALYEVKAAGCDFHMVIGGSGSLRSSLEALTEQLGLARHVAFVGRVSEEDLPLMYGAADAFVLPTSALECFGLIILEALACGRPVLATPAGAIPELLDPIEPRWMAQDTRVESIAALIIDYLKGRLPVHEPQALRDAVARQYQQQPVIERLVAVALGEAPTVAAPQNGSAVYG